jgi:26S proteasome regulatory subunit N9
MTTLLESIPSTLQEGAKLLAKEGSVDVIVYSAYYEAATAYQKIVGPPEEFYKAALLYLHYTPLDDMSTEERYTLATNLSLAAITGDGIFNFGELTTTPLLQTALHNTPNAWLMDLLQCFAQGDFIGINMLFTVSSKQRIFVSS